MKHHQIMRRGLSILLSLVMCLSLLPVTALAEEADTAAAKAKAIQLDTGEISGYDSENGYDYIYFGYWEAPDEHTTTGPIKWRVLDTKTNMEDAKEGDGLFLLSEELLGSGSYGDVHFQQTYHSGSLNGIRCDLKGDSHDGSCENCQIAKEWQGSDAQAWCGTFYSNNLTSLEQGAVLVTTKSDKAFTSDRLFPASENILNGDKVFFLSAEEAETGDYGFTDNDARIVNYDSDAKQAGKSRSHYRIPLLPVHIPFMCSTSSITAIK